MPFADPTVPDFFSSAPLPLPLPPPLPKSTSTVVAAPVSPVAVSLTIDLFAKKVDWSWVVRQQWPVDMMKLYPEAPHRNWVMIMDQRIEVGSSVFGGRVISLTSEYLVVQRGGIRRSFRFVPCGWRWKRGKNPYPEKSGSGSFVACDKDAFVVMHP